MAKRYLLVSPNWISDTSSTSDNLSINVTQYNPKNPQHTTIVDTIEEGSLHDERGDMVNLFPKRQQNKAKLLIGHLKHVKVDTNNRVIYGDGTVGSSLYDLVRYFITSVGHFRLPSP